MPRVALSGLLVFVSLIIVTVGVGLNGSRPANAQETTLEQGVKATMNSAVAAYNRGDFASLARHFTEKGFEAEFFQSKSEAAANPDFFGDTVELRGIRNVTATGTGATAVVDFVAGLGISSETLSFISQGGIWVVNDAEPASAVIPPGADVVDLKLQEFAFVFEQGALASGNFAFRAENTGKQEHEIVILQLASEMSIPDLLAALESEDESLIQDFGFLGFLDPGDSGTAALSRPLDDGYYALICFIPDVDEVPHAFKGMVSQFSVGSPPARGGTISPPNTGEAGLASTAGGASPWIVAAGVLFLGVGAATGLRSLRS